MPCMSQVQIQNLLRAGVIHYRIRPVLSVEAGGGAQFHLVPTWHHPSIGLLEWDHVARLAEYIAIDEHLTAQFLARACEYLEETASQHGWGPSLTVSVSFKALAAKGFAQRLQQRLLRAATQPHRLRLEFRGATFIDGPTTALRNLVACRDYGVRIAIHGVEDVVGLDRVIRRFSPELGTIGNGLSRWFAAGRGTERLHALQAYADRLGVRLGVEGVGDLNAYLALLSLGFAEFQGPAIGDDRPLPPMAFTGAFERETELHPVARVI
jgi:EAL domain-containing protein (putative c-di-GMP-specific phosphodiesterase class I)